MSVVLVLFNSQRTTLLFNTNIFFPFVHNFTRIGIIYVSGKLVARVMRGLFFTLFNLNVDIL